MISVRTRSGESPWLWISGITGVILMLYLGGAVVARVMFDRGKFRQGSKTFDVVVMIYHPLELVANSNPSFLRAFEACVSVFTPQPEDESP